MKRNQPRAQPTQARSQKRLELILSTAQRLFLAAGVEETTTNDIAAAAKIPIGSIYRYYRNKNEIIIAINASYVQDVSAIMNNIKHDARLGEWQWKAITSLLLTQWIEYCQVRKPFTALYFQRSSPALQQQTHVLEYELFGVFLSLIGAKRELHNKIAQDDTLEIARMLVLYKGFTTAVETMYELRDDDMADQVFTHYTRLIAASLDQIAPLTQEV